MYAVIENKNLMYIMLKSLICTVIIGWKSLSKLDLYIEVEVSNVLTSELRTIKYPPALWFDSVVDISFNKFNITSYLARNDLGCD